MKDTLIERLRGVCQTLRRTPMPIAQVIPMLQEAADTIEALQAENERYQQDRNREKKLRKDSDDRAHNAEADRDALAAKLVPLTQQQRMAVWNSVKNEGDGKWEFSFSDVVNAVEAAYVIQAKGGQHE